MQATDKFWPIELVDGTLVSVEPDLGNLSTYVLVEQEDWLEKEIVLVRRLLQPAMCAIDIGANIGIYTLVMARLVGPDGHVVAIEPQDGPRQHLERALDLNGLANVEILGVAISDRSGTGRMETGPDSETASLKSDGGVAIGAADEVALMTLDRLVESMRTPPDFIKIDAEGAERSILAGGKDCLARHQPIVMVEVKARFAINTELLGDLQNLGFGLYRALPDGIGLVPYALDEPLDDYELNIFACPPRRAAELEQRGLLATEKPEWHADRGVDAPNLVAWLRCRPYSSGFPAVCSAVPTSEGYGEALAAYCAWSSAERPLAWRYAALRFAFNRMIELVQAVPTLPRLMTLMRVAAEAGQRKVVVALAKPILEQIDKSGSQIDEPFLPPHPRYDNLAPHGDLTAWLIAALGEQYERARMYSSKYGVLWPGVINACVSGYASTEMFRRVALRGIVDATEKSVDVRLLDPAPDHRNYLLWRRIIG